MKNKSESLRPGSRSGRVEPATKHIPAPAPAFERIPTYEEITARAQILWLEQGSPVGRDEQIWLEAERELAQQARDLEREEPMVPIDEDGYLARKVQAHLEEIVRPAAPRSPTSL